jgi:hypothetical protein
MTNRATLGAACWLGAVTVDDRPAWLPVEDVPVHRQAAEREAERIRREQEAARENAEEELRARLHRRRVVESVTGAPSVPSIPEVLARESARGDRAEAAQELRAGIADGSVLNLDAPVPARRPPEVQQVADKRGGREARELGEDLAAAGQPVAGAMYAELGKEGKAS